MYFGRLVPMFQRNLPSFSEYENMLSAEGSCTDIGRGRTGTEALSEARGVKTVRRILGPLKSNFPSA